MIASATHPPAAMDSAISSTVAATALAAAVMVGTSGKRTFDREYDPN